MSTRRPADSLFGAADADPPRQSNDAPVEPATFDDALRRLGRLLPKHVYLGTSSWAFPGWQGLVYGGAYGETQLARAGLAAYAQHPLLRAVGINRGFYQPLAAREFARYAQQVPDGFRFVVKAPALIADAFARGERGAPDAPNPHFLDAAAALEQFVAPVLEGLQHKAGALVFQLSPLPREWLRNDAAVATIERIGAFFERLPRTVGGHVPVVALELRNHELLTPRLVRTLRAAQARLCLGIHARMPEATRHSAALRALDAAPEDGDNWTLKGPLVVRWLLHAGFSDEAAKQRYAPFDRLLDSDVLTRGTLAHLIHVAVRSGQPAYVIAGNKAEGSAPLTCIDLARAVVGR